ncbi:capsular polysaccharide biosynthesis protein [Actinokineospora cianjurensis]|uniref:Capsular polysaccharide biosynthesis protein n=2 Tax=Actinokineospora cianjurensis TaxID=585224 RepID=A0A421B875_9PSEU|nr:capsular polysaccharide biosynthesis protein [Actinokineospora cianjurensis]
MMDFFKTLLLMLKRWYIALPVFAVTVGAAGGAYVAIPLHYESVGTMVLTSPAGGATSVTDKVPGQTNPLLAFETSLTISAAIVIQSINTPEVVKSLGGDSPDHKFVLTGGGDGGPFITVKTESASEPGARELAVKVLDRVKAELAKRQQALNAPPSTFIGVDDVVPPTKPEPLRGGKLRGAAVALVLGLAASLTVVYFLETRRERKRLKDNPDEDEFDDDLDPEDDRGEPARPARREPEPPRQNLPPVTRTPQPLGSSASERTQMLRPAQVEPGTTSTPNGRPANGAPTTGTKSGQLPAPGSASNRRPGQGNRSPEEYREPPTVRVKPAQAPQEPRG